MTRISCIIPVYNGADYIQETIESVLHQSTPLDQLIVVDDGSEDTTPEIVGRFGDQLTFLKKPHTGIADTLNHGLREASGSLIAFLDADDLWHPDKTKIQQEWLMANPGFDAVFCHIKEFVSPELSEDVRSELVIRAEPLRGMNKTCMLIRKTFFDRVGLFSPQDDMGDFIEWFSRAQDLLIQYHVLDDILCYRRVHLHNFTRTQRAQIPNFTQILKRSLERKRMNL